MFYIHGGEFEHGSGNEFPGQQLAFYGRVVSLAFEGHKYKLLLSINTNFATYIIATITIDLDSLLGCSYLQL